jgi:hypothetical protein
MTDIEPTIATVVVKRDEGVNSTTMAATPYGHPDVVLKALNPWKIVLIRSARVFFQTLAGSIGVASFGDLVSIKTAVIIAASTAGVTALQNAAELLAKLDQSYPEVRG